MTAISRLVLLPVLIAACAATATAQQAQTEPPAKPSAEAGVEIPAAGDAVPEVAPVDMLFTINNLSGSMVMDFLVSAPGEDAWSADLSRGGVVSQGSSAVIRVPGGATQCAFDVRFVLADGSIVEDTVNMCERGIYSVRPPVGTKD